jgi:hypothetical protein
MGGRRCRWEEFWGQDGRRGRGPDDRGRSIDPADARCDSLARVRVAGGAGALYSTMNGMGLVASPATAHAARTGQQKAWRPPSPSGLGLRGRARGEIVSLDAGVPRPAPRAPYGLGKAGYRCRILNACSRPGGRNWTARGGRQKAEIDGPPQRAEFSKDQYIDCAVPCATPKARTASRRGARTAQIGGSARRAPAPSVRPARVRAPRLRGGRPSNWAIGLGPVLPELGRVCGSGVQRRVVFPVRCMVSAPRRSRSWLIAERRLVERVDDTVVARVNRLDASR